MTNETTASALVLARSPRSKPEDVATALADAFLASNAWNDEELIKAASLVLGARLRWLPRLAAEITTTFLRAPIGSPRLLAATILRSLVFVEAVTKANARRAPLHVRHRVLAPTPAREPAGALPRIDSVSGLADVLDLSIGHLEWFADAKNWNRRARSEQLHHYRYEWRVREGRVPRLLEIPEQRMRRTQRRLLERVLSFLPVADAAHGFVPGRSAITGAARHTGSAIVIALDLTAFFAHVTAPRIYGTLRRSGYGEAVAHTLTGLCTNVVPPRVLAAMPPGGSPDDRYALRRALASSHLPQGAPSSPMLANLTVHRLDARLTGWAEAIGATYTRYADDLSFSGGDALAKRPDAFIRGAERIIKDEGLVVNARKTRVRRRAVKQTVTGIVVNEHVNFSRVEYDRLKATIHNCVVLGPASQNLGGAPDFRTHLRGRISWVESLNPARGQMLLREFERIRW